MPDQPQAFAGADREVDAGKRANGTEAFRHALQADDLLRCVPIQSSCLIIRAFSRRAYQAEARAVTSCRRPPSGVFQRVLGVGDATLFGVRQVGLEIVLLDREERHGDVLRDLLAVEDQLRDPEGEGRDTRCDRGRHGLIAARVLLFLPPLQLILTVAHDDDRCRPAGRLEGLGGAVAVAALSHDRLTSGSEGSTPATAFCARLRPVAVHRADDLELRVLLDAFLDAGMDVVIDRDAGQARDLQQVAAVGHGLLQIVDLRSCPSP